MKVAIKKGLTAVGLEETARTARTFASGRVARRDAKDGRHLAMLLAFVLRPDHSCVDIGAHTGEVLREMVRLAPAGTHVAFEPIPSFAAELQHAFPTVDVRAAAVAERAGEATFEWDVTRPAVSGFSARREEGHEVQTLRVPVVRLDDSLAIVPDLIKIDVEGAEEGVLRGAEETLAHRPWVILEHGEGAKAYGTAPATVYDLLTRPGLRVFDLDGGGPYSRAQFEESVARGAIWNYVAH
jgi:FkbM family methyltransferase